MLKSTYKYIINSLYKGLLLFYLVLMGILVTTIIISSFSSSGNVLGLELASVIVLFIFGFFIFKEIFHFVVSNSVSRKTMFIGLMLSFLSIALVMSIIDYILALILMIGDFFANEYTSLYDQTFFDKSLISLSGFDFITRTLGCMIFTMAMYFVMLLIPFVISTVFYRLSVKARVITVILFIAMFNFMPFFISMSSTLVKLVNNILELIKQIYSKPVNATFFTLGITAFLCVISWFTIRRVKINESSLKG